MKDLLAYLFGGSQVENEVEETKSAIERIMEEAEEQEPLKVKRTPLINALKALGLKDVSDEVQYDPEGFSLVCPDEQEYREYVRLLMEPDAMEKLAKLGWVVTRCGDVAMTNEPAEMRIRFLEITTAGEDGEEGSWPAPNDKLMKSIVKKGREFMSEPGPHDKEGEVEYDDKTSDDNQKGVSKAQAGKDPEGKPKGSSKSEGLALAERILVNEEERCPHCEGQGYVDDEGNPKNEDMAAGDPGVHKCPRCKGRKTMPKAHAARYKSGVEREVSKTLGKPWKYEAVGDIQAWLREVRHFIDTQTPFGGGNTRYSEAGSPMDPKEELETIILPALRYSGPKAAQYLQQAQELYQQLGEALNEGGHKKGCPCGFCKNMGSFGKKKAEKPEADEEPEADEPKVESKYQVKTVDWIDKKTKKVVKKPFIQKAKPRKDESEPPRYDDMFEALGKKKARGGKEVWKHGQYWPASLVKNIRRHDKEMNVNPKSGLSHAPDCDCDTCAKRRQPKNRK